MDGTISCLTTTSFADAALLHHLSTMSSSFDYSCSHLLHYARPVHYSSSSPPPPPPPPPPAAGGRRQNQQHAAPARGRSRIAKRRRSRASKRAPTTYISTDPSNFSLMVQHITGVQQQAMAADDPTITMLLAADDPIITNPLLMTTTPGDHQQQQHQEQQQPCFPTLDSWNVTSMYDQTRNDL